MQQNDAFGDQKYHEETYYGHDDDSAEDRYEAYENEELAAILRRN